MMSTEFERVARLRARFKSPDPKDVPVAIGDDGAVLRPSRASQVLSVDAAVENVHFRRAWGSMSEIAYRAFVVALSDLAAMGAQPRCSLVSLILPNTVSETDFDELIDGLADASAATGAPIVGGNLTAGDQLSITTTVVGEIEGAPLLRQGARPGDGVYVTGVVGARALGLALLERGTPLLPEEELFARAWMRPAAQVQIGQRLRHYATACIDVSDGLMQDLGHVCRASGTGAEVFVESLPFAPSYAHVCRSVGRDPIKLALSGGEDYELLFTAPVHATPDELATRIGQMTGDPGEVRAIGSNGAPIALGDLGFDHFRAQK